MKRKVNEPPFAVTKEGMKFHHLGVPTDEIKPNEKYLERYKFYVSGFDTSNYGVEWMRFEDDSPVHELIQRAPHLAFEVDDLEKAVEGKEMLGEITSPGEGIRTAMIVENGAPIEFIEFDSSCKF